LLDVNLGAGQPSGIDAYRWLREHSFPGRIVFLTGHATTSPEVIAARSHGQTVLEKPIDIVKLGALVTGAPAR
jgi:DNA-binding response OmpR family regulator